MIELTLLASGKWRWHTVLSIVIFMGTSTSNNQEHITSSACQELCLRASLLCTNTLNNGRLGEVGHCRKIVNSGNLECQNDVKNNDASLYLNLDFQGRHFPLWWKLTNNRHARANATGQEATCLWMGILNVTQWNINFSLSECILNTNCYER